MTGSWVASLIILSARVATAVDFVLLKVRIYEIPSDVKKRRLLFKKMGVKRIKKDKLEKIDGKKSLGPKTE